jgi:hypothetical protein
MNQIIIIIIITEVIDNEIIREGIKNNNINIKINIIIINTIEE